MRNAKTRNPTPAPCPLRDALRRALRDERDPAVRRWIKALLAGDGK